MVALAAMMTLVETSAEATTFLRIVLDGYLMRQACNVVETLADVSRNERFLDSRSTFESCASQIAELCLTEHNQKSMDVFVEAEAMLQRLADGETPRQSKPIYSGIKCVDDDLGPLDVATSDFNVLLMGPTSYGKSSLATQYISESISRGYRVVVFMGETARIDLPLQVAAQRERVMTGVRYFHTEPMDRQRLAMRAVRNFKGEAAGLLHIFDTNFTIESISSRCRSIEKKEGPIDLVVIDHIHLLKTVHRVRDTRERLDHLSGCLKPLAKDLECVILTLAQPSREGQGDRPPKLSDLKESGSLENDADRVLALYPLPHDSTGQAQTRTELYPEVQLHQLKMRKGPVGDVTLRFHKPYTLFTELEEEKSGY